MVVDVVFQSEAVIYSMLESKVSEEHEHQAVSTENEIAHYAYSPRVDLQPAAATADYTDFGIEEKQMDTEAHGSRVVEADKHAIGMLSDQHHCPATASSHSVRAQMEAVLDRRSDSPLRLLVVVVVVLEFAPRPQPCYASIHLARGTRQPSASA